MFHLLSVREPRTYFRYQLSGAIWHCEFFVNIDSINSLGPSDAIWRQRSRSTLAQVMACCLTAPSHYLNQCWLIIGMVQWHLYEGSFTRDTSTIDHLNQLENYSYKIYSESPRGQRVNGLLPDGTIPLPDPMLIHHQWPLGPCGIHRRVISLAILKISVTNMSLTHWGWDKMAAVSQKTFSNVFYWMKMHEFRLRFHWSLFLRV